MNLNGVLVIAAILALLLLLFAPMIIFHLISNSCRVIFLLLTELCKCAYPLYENIAASFIIHKIPNFMSRVGHTLIDALWIIVDLPNYVERWTLDKNRIDDSIDNTYTPNVVSSENSPMSTPSVTSSLSTNLSTHDTADPSVTHDRVICAGYTKETDHTEKRQCTRNRDKPMGLIFSTWYCYQHRWQAKKPLTAEGESILRVPAHWHLQLTFHRLVLIQSLEGCGHKGYHGEASASDRLD